MPMQTEEVASALAKVPLFEGISAESLTRLAAVTGELDFQTDQFIVLQGQVGTGLYVIVEGEVKVVRGSDELIRLGPNDFFGELSVIDQLPRSASVQATMPTRTLALASWDLLDLLESDPKLSLNLITGLVTRVREHGERHHH
jgi:CRP/FNR family transcriptional regulator, cyclic AMP receptor protein